MNESIEPNKKVHPLPDEKTHLEEVARLEKLVEEQRSKGREIVAVMGLGFVGIIMAAIVADSVDKCGKPRKFVIGLQRPSKRSYWKIPVLNKGISPIDAEDPEVKDIIKRTVIEKATLTATFSNTALSLADIIVVDVQCDFKKPDLGKVITGHVDMEAFKASIKTLGQCMNPEALIVIETTVPPGTTEHIVMPIFKEEFAKRGIGSPPLVAHSYERVMPGKEYVRSIRDFWRVCSGVNDESKKRVVKFLSEVLNVKDYPITILEHPIESETAKIIENSWRANIIAFMNEWSLYSEKVGVDLQKVVNAITPRPTHRNMMFTGPGVGGYCLPKDGGFGAWAYKNIFGFKDNIFRLTTMAIDINDTRALHVVELIEDALKEMNKKIKGANVLILGAAYREDIDDTRYSPSELMIRKLADVDAVPSVHDPYVKSWPEFETQDENEFTWAKHFKNQKKLKNIKVGKYLEQTLHGMDVLVFAVRHQAYFDLKPEDCIKMAGKPLAVIDAFGVLNDDALKKYLKLGCTVKAMGRGHIKRLIP